MKKKILFVVALFLLLVSCAAPDYNRFYDSVSYEVLTTFEYEDNNYEVMIPINIDEAIVHYYEIGNNKSNSKEWTINYKFVYDYNLFDIADPYLIDSLYTALNSSYEELSTKLGDNPSIMANNTLEIIEEILYNPNSNEAEYVIVKDYLPILLENDYKNYMISVPINVHTLLKINDKIEDFGKDKYITWDDFLSIPNMRNGEVYEEI